MIIPPSYFEPIRRKAADRWAQLERDPDLAAPWHQLFKQVQSPRHIVSELLQNADDAGAREASVRIEDGAFVFEHDGEDFCEDHFASLCRFGYSNKRVLHTIGFRGIGFKSTFSLGDAVELYTPTLSVVFHRRRFTEPYWLNSTLSVNGLTRVRVAISDENRKREVEKNLDEWFKSPTSLLFFKHIRRLKIGAHDLQWCTTGKGPVSDSEWMHLTKKEAERFLIIRSELKSFPEEAVAEIAQERMLDGAESTDFPPCKVEIVLGASGRLYVVLPTGVETSLPFACNAPFIQDPARLKIKDPETSPTNRWLLERISELAASVMLEWLDQPSLSLADRSEAYGVMPDVDREDSSIEGVCAAIAELAFANAIQNENYVFTQSGKLVGKGKSVVIPPKLFDVWPEDKVSEYFDAESRPPLSRYITEADCTKLLNWRAVEKIDRNHCLEVLQSSSLSQPETWKQLLTLWEFVAPDMIRLFRDNPVAKRLRIVPVHGRDVLYAATEVVRLGEKRLLQSEEDWVMLSTNLLVLNQNWPRFISECHRIAETNGDKELENRANVASKLLSAIGLEDTSDTSKVIEQVAASFFSNQSIYIKDCVQLAQIACKLGVSIGNSFRFVTRDNYLRSADYVVVYDPKSKLESLLPEAWCAQHTLHDAYSNAWSSCSSDDWNKWINTGRPKFASFVPIANRNALFRKRDGSVFDTMYGCDEIIREMEKRGFSGAPDYRYRNYFFQIDDWDFDEELWRHWEQLASDDKNIWGEVMRCVLEQPFDFWDKAKNARALQIATTGTRASITNEPLLPSWIIKFRELPCLPDTRGFYRNPSDLLRRTPETESLLDVEPFVHGSIDNEAIRPLLDLLGVGTVPTGPDKLLDRLRALSKAENPPVHEVEKWYVRLDQMAESCSTDDFSKIKQALLQEKIILTESMYWAKGSAVYLSADDDDVPVADLIRRSVADLTLWRKIGAPERPTADMAIQWLNSLSRNLLLPPEDLNRVKALMHRHASRIWNECNCWLNLANELVNTDSLRYSLSMRTLTQWDHLFKWVLQETADFCQLPPELTDDPPFSNIPSLVSQLKEQFINDPIANVHEDQKPWMKRFGMDLNRIELNSNDEQTRVRELGANLADSRWLELSELEVVPYLNGIPAGIPKNVEVVWSKRIVYVKSLPEARLARLVPHHLGKVFGRDDIASALNYCFGRSPDEVTDYLEENFHLQPAGAPVISNKSDEIEADSISPAKVAPAPIAIDVVIDEQNTANEVVDVAPTEADEAAQSDYLPSEESRQSVEPEKPRQQPSLPKHGIIEKFMAGLEYRKDRDNYFTGGQDGCSFSRSSKDMFSLVKSDQDGNVVYRYWVKDQCIESEPLQVDAVVWGMIDKFPEAHGFLLSDQAGNPVEIRGEKLKTMRDKGLLKIYPATYRLVIES